MTLPLTAGFFSWSALLFLLSAACSQFSGWRHWDRSRTGAGSGCTEQSECEIHRPQCQCHPQRVGPMSYGTVQYQETGHKIPSFLCCKMGALGWPSGLSGRSNWSRRRRALLISQPLRKRALLVSLSPGLQTVHEITLTIPVPVFLHRALCSGLMLFLLNHSGPWSPGRDGLKHSTPELWEAHGP